MGMYTELHFNAELSGDVPPEVVTILDYMLASASLAELPEPPLPDHPLFHTERWRLMLQMDSCYFSADTHSTLRKDDRGDCYFLCVRCNLKNYNHEIEKFIDWVCPYLRQEDGDFLGFYRYEDSEDPTLIYAPSRVKT